MPLPPRPDLGQLRKQARELLRSAQAGQPDALQRFQKAHPRFGPSAPLPPIRLSDAQLVLARQQLQRQQNLMKEEATTEEALQTAQAAVSSYTAQIEALKAQMQQTESELRGNEANLGYTKIYAPMTGTVVSQTAKRGQTLNANQQAPIILRIADLTTMTVQTQVSEADVPKLQLGMEAYFTTLGGNNQRWRGELRQVLPTPTVTNG